MHLHARSHGTLDQTAGPVSQLSRVLTALALCLTGITAAAVAGATSAVTSAAIAAKPASASSPKTALVYGPALDSSPVCSTTPPYSTFNPVPGNGISDPCGEVQNLESQGWAVTITDQGGSTPTWDSLTAEQFASYQLLVLPDPDCVFDDSPLADAVSNETTWAPEVTGNVIITGTDPIYHESLVGDGESADADPAKYIYQALAYAGAQTGKTGLYLDLSCYYNNEEDDQSVPILNGLQTAFGDSPAWTVGSASDCGSDIHVAASAQQLIGVTDADMSGWECSTHEYAETWPSDFVPYALYTDVQGGSGSEPDDPCTHLYTSADGDATGCPYILGRGGGLSAGSVSLFGPGGSANVGTDQTLTASVEIDGSAVDDASVTLSCVSGPCTPVSSANITTDSSGDATFSYSSSLPGTDEWVAKYTPPGGGVETSGEAAVVWTGTPVDFTASAVPSTNSYPNGVELEGTGFPDGATGTITFSYDGSQLCIAEVSDGSGSCPTGTEAPGTYDPVDAVYSGGGGYLGNTETTEFTIDPESTSTSTSVKDASTGGTWSGSEGPGATAYDTASVVVGEGGDIRAGLTPHTSVGGISGTLVYSFFTNGTCSDDPSQTSSVSVSNGTAGQSATTGALSAGSYSFEARYEGSTDYASSTASCEPFTVGKAAPTLTNTVEDAATGTPWSGSEVTGSAAYDSSTITGTEGYTPTGTVTYTLYSGTTCSGTVLQSSPETISESGSVPTSADSPALGGGTYSYVVSYPGDANNAASVSPCESFTVGKATPTVVNAVHDASTGSPWSGSEVTGAKAYDASTVGGVAGFTPTMSVTYSLFSGSTCTSTAIQTSTEPISAGAVPNSATTAALAPGTYSYDADYLGDGNYVTVTSSCVSFTVSRATPAVANAVDDASTGSPWSGSEVTGATAYDTSTVAGVGGFTPSGTVLYTLFSGGSCTGTTLQTSGKGLSGGLVPNSATTVALTPATYSYDAAYMGDANYAGATSTCASFTVGQATPAVTNTVDDDASTGTAWSGSEVTGATAYDTSTVAGVTGFTPGGSVLYNVYAGGSCQGTPLQTSTENLSGGLVPNSATTARLGAGTYVYQGVYSGDSNYQTAMTACETFSVARAPRSVGTVVYDGGSESPWNEAEVTGASAYDTATVGAVAGPLEVPSLSVRGLHVAVPHVSGPILPTGTVTYELFDNISCSESPVSTEQVTLSGGNVPSSAVTGPLPAGNYGYDTSYSGDVNYQPATGSCEPFTVLQAQSATSATVFDATQNASWTDTEVTGASAYGTSSVAPSPAPTPVAIEPTGEVTYSFFASATCTGDAFLTNQQSISEGLVPQSTSTAALAAGSYGLEASYDGDDNYIDSQSFCESFTVQPATPTVANAVQDAATSSPWSGVEVTGASAFDTSSVKGISGFTPTGKVTYDLFTNGTCAGQASTVDPTTLASGVVPASADTAALGAGPYSFEALYAGDDNYEATTSSCVEFSVARAPTVLLNIVQDDTPGGNEVTGAAAYDTATVTGVPGFPDTGTVVYTFYTGTACAGEGVAGGVTLSGGVIPNSSVTAPLAAGSYSFKAVYSGDVNYIGSTSSCAPFSVGLAPTATTQVVWDSINNVPWSGTHVTGATAYDSASVAWVPGFTGTGSVTYSFYGNGSCSGKPTWTQTAGLTAGVAPNSNGTGSMPDGSYSFVVSYSGDSNYLGSASVCKSMVVAKAATSTAGVVYDTATQSPWTGAEYQGATAYDTSTVTGVPGYTPTGTLTYTYFTNSTCSGSPSSTQTVNLSGGNVPSSSSTAGLPASSFSYQAVYSGDADYLGSTGACEPFTTKLIGYRLYGGDGGVFTFQATYRGSVGFPSPPGLGLHIYDFVGAAAIVDGYWLVESDGGIFSFGNAQYYGSLPGSGVTVSNIVGIAATADGKGYWEVSSTGQIYPFGDAVSHGDLPGDGIHVNDIVAIESPYSGGYWLVGANGGVYTFGDAKYEGSCGVAGSPCQGATDIVGIASPNSTGYWLVGKDGGVFGFGTAPFHGSCPQAGSGCAGVSDVIGIGSPDAGGYWLATPDGAVYAFGDAKYLGNEVGTDLIRPIVAVTNGLTS
jgi:hypothetical protein